MKKRTYVIAIAAVVIVVAALLIKYFSSGTKPATIILPTPASQASSGQPEAENGLIVVTPQTVCAALSAQSRVESYSRSYSVTTYWDGGECADSLSVWQKGENLRMSLDHAGTVKSLLVTDGSLYIWYDGVGGSSKSTYYKDFDYRDADRFARLLTYEELYDAPAEAITDAGYSQQQGEPCIFAEYTGENNYVNRVYVSVNTGLLVSAEIYDGDTLIYSMQSTTTELSTPADEIFLPPKS